MARFKLDRKAARNLLKQEGVQDLVRESTKDVARHAEALIGEGEFADSLGTKFGQDKTRFWGRVTTDDPGFLAIEFGTRDTPPKAPLRRAIKRAGLETRSTNDG